MGAFPCGLCTFLPLFQSEKGNDPGNRQIHLLLLHETMIGTLDGIKLDHVIFGKSFDRLEGDDLILCALQNQKIIGLLQIIPFSDVRFLETIEKDLIDLNFPVKADEGGFAFVDQLPVVIGHDGVLHHFIHVDRRAAEGHLDKGHARLGDIFQKEIPTEAGCVDIKLRCGKLLVHPRKDQPDIGIAVLQPQLLVDIIAMTGPVEGHDGDIFILFQNAFGKALRCFVVLVTAETMPKENELSDLIAVGRVKLAADAAALRVDIKVYGYRL